MDRAGLLIRWKRIKQGLTRPGGPRAVQGLYSCRASCTSGGTPEEGPRAFVVPRIWLALRRDVSAGGVSAPGAWLSNRKAIRSEHSPNALSSRGLGLCCIHGTRVAASLPLEGIESASAGIEGRYRWFRRGSLRPRLRSVDRGRIPKQGDVLPPQALQDLFVELRERAS